MASSSQPNSKLLFYQNLAAAPTTSGLKTSSLSQPVDLAGARFTRIADWLAFLHFEALPPTNTTQRLRNTGVMLVTLTEPQYTSDKEQVVDLAEGFQDVSLRTVYMLRYNPLSASGGGKTFHLYGFFTKYINATVTEEFFGFADCHLPAFGMTFNCLLIVREDEYRSYKDISVLRFNQFPPFERTWRLELLLEEPESLRTRYFAYTRTKNENGTDLITDQSFEDILPFSRTYGLSNTSLLMVKKTIPGMRAFRLSTANQQFVMLEVNGVNSTANGSTIIPKGLFWIPKHSFLHVGWAVNKDIFVLTGSADVSKDFSALACSSYHTIESLSQARQSVKLSMAEAKLKGPSILSVPLIDPVVGTLSTIDLSVIPATTDLVINSAAPKYQYLFAGEQVHMQTDLQMITGSPYTLDMKLVSSAGSKPVETESYGPLMRLTYYNLVEEDGVARLVRPDTAPLEYIGTVDYVLDVATKDLLTCKEAFTTDGTKGMMCSKKSSSALMPKDSLDLEEYPLYFLNSESLISYSSDSTKFTVLFYMKDKYRKSLVKVCFYIVDVESLQEKVDCKFITSITTPTDQTSLIVIRPTFVQFIFGNGTGIQSVYYSNEGEVIYSENVMLTSDLKTMDQIQYMSNKTGNLLAQLDFTLSVILSNGVYMLDFLKGKPSGSMKNLSLVPILVSNPYRMCLMAENIIVANLQGIYLLALEDGKLSTSTYAVEMFSTRAATASGLKLKVFEMLCSTDDVTHVIFEDLSGAASKPNMWLFEIQDSLNLLSDRFSQSALLPVPNLNELLNLHSFYTGQTMYMYQPGATGDNHFMIDMSFNRPRMTAPVSMDATSQEIVATATDTFNSSNKKEFRMTVKPLKFENDIQYTDQYAVSASKGKQDMFDLVYNPREDNMRGHFWNVKIVGPNSKKTSLRVVNRLDPVLATGQDKSAPFPAIPSDGTSAGAPKVITFFGNKDYYLFVTLNGLYFSLASSSATVSYLGPITNPSMPMRILDIFDLQEMSNQAQDSKKILITVKVETDSKKRLAVLSFMLNKQNKPSKFIEEMPPLFEISSQQIAVKSVLCQNQPTRVDVLAGVLETLSNHTFSLVNTYPTKSIVMEIPFVETFDIVALNTTSAEASSLLIYKTLQGDELKIKHFFPKCSKSVDVVVKGLKTNPTEVAAIGCQLRSGLDANFTVGCVLAGFKVFWVEMEYTMTQNPCSTKLEGLDTFSLQQTDAPFISVTVQEEYESYKNMNIDSIYIERSSKPSYFLTVGRRSRSGGSSNFHDAAGVLYYPRRKAGFTGKQFAEGGLMSIDLLKLGHFGIPKIFPAASSQNLILASESNYTMLKLSEPAIVGQAIEEALARKGFRIEVFGEVSHEVTIKPKEFPTISDSISKIWLYAAIGVLGTLLLLAIGIYSYKKFNRSVGPDGEVQNDETIVFSRVRAETSKAALADSEL